MNQNTADSETILRGVLDGWKAAVDKHRPDQVAAHFTDDAIFQGLRPYSIGRPGIAAYYDSQPPGLTAEYRVLETRRLSDDLVLGYPERRLLLHRPSHDQRLPRHPAETDRNRLGHRLLPGLQARPGHHRGRPRRPVAAETGHRTSGWPGPVKGPHGAVRGEEVAA